MGALTHIRPRDKMRKYTPRANRPPLSKILEAIKDSGGVFSVIAKRLGITRNAIMNYAREFEEVADAVAAEKEENLDLAENKLIANIHKGDMGAITFYLRCKGRGRGYNDRVDSHISGSLTIAKPPPSIEEIAKARQEILDAVKGDV